MPEVPVTVEKRPPAPGPLDHGLRNLAEELYGQGEMVLIPGVFLTRLRIEEVITGHEFEDLGRERVGKNKEESRGNPSTTWEVILD